MRTIILLDVDGVLVYDGGYRASAVATINYFAAQLGLRGMAPTEEEIDAFHAAGFTNEWVFNPLAVGILRLAAAQGKPVRRPDYLAWIERTRAHPGNPTERAVAVLLDELARLSLPGSRRSRLEADLKALLADPYDVYRCPTTQVLQEFALGSRLYADYYGLPSRFDSPSLLEQEDEPALTPEGRARLERLVVAQGAQVCIYTARPSGPPSLDASLPALKAGDFPLAPEAELAVRLLDLEQYPLIAMGRMQWLADRHGETAEALTKPSPVQVLAALGAAVSGEEVPALEAAYALYRHGQFRPPLADLTGQHIQVFVLEDATLGLQAAADGLRLLEKYGLSTQMRGIGVTRSPAKTAALIPYCETIVPDVNVGLAWIEEKS